MAQAARSDERAPALPTRPAYIVNPAYADSRPLGPTVRRYAIAQLAFAFFLLIAVFAFAVLAAELVDYSDLVINRGFGAREVATIVLHRMVPVIAQTLPFALLVASLTAIGRLGADRALLALEASGVAPLRLVRPVFVFSLAVTAVALVISWEVTPRMNRALNAAIADAASRNPGGSLRSGIPATFGDWRIEAREVSSSGEQLRGVAAFAPPIGETIFARSGRFERQGDDRARIVLEDGVFLMPVEGHLSQVRFDSMDQAIELDQGDVHVVDPMSGESALSLMTTARSDPDPRLRRGALTELHARVALPMAGALFGWLAVPMLLVRGRPSRAGGAALGFAATAAYYGLVQLGHGLARSENIPVAAAVWLPNALLAATALGLSLRVRRGRLRESISTRMAARRARKKGAQPPRAHRLIMDRYVFARFVEIAVICFAVLLLAYLLIDVMDNLKWFTRYNSTPFEILRYYGARLPLLVSRVLPLALIAAAALTTSLLVASGELLGMRACGISAARTVTPIVVACVLLAGFYHLLANEWTPHASALARQIKNVEIKNRDATRHQVWLQSPKSLYEIAWLDPLAGQAEGLTLYDLEDGLPKTRTDAVRARHIGNGVWNLGEALVTDIEPGSIAQTRSATYVKLGDDLPAEVDTGDLPLRELQQAIRDAIDDGFDPTPMQVEAHLRRAAPLACVVLPALALAFAMIGPPFATLGQMILVSFALALAHGLLTALGASLGNGKVLEPWVAGWGPIAVVASSGVLIAWRARSAVRG
ncbi:MAG TPA: LptF/LptG family permease [Myxococcota bacterium]|nr:LptF/LptG family permease [Myxococcota bacterium]